MIMSIFYMIGSAIGGIGLFVLGMSLMSNGLKTASGSSLHHFLRHWTKTPFRGLSLGFVLTSLIQSSSAITITIIGFCNAGLLSLKRAAWVVFGSNVGTTTTGWIVALIGLNIKVSSFALPLIGIGMLLNLSKKNQKISGLGKALLGFGLLFLGITVLKDTFSDLSQLITFDNSGADASLAELLLFLGIGFLITLLMQSSSVTLAITLTALSGGVISLLGAAAVVVGGNLGTTSTAMIASFGTNAVAKRVVASHLIFNLVSAVVTFIFLAPFVSLIVYGQQQLFADNTSTTSLALFHTFFNILGVVLIWPFVDALLKWLSQQFKDDEEDSAKPLYLNKQSLSLPSLALHALNKELERISQYALNIAVDSIKLESISNTLKPQDQSIKKLITALGDYTSKLYKQNLSDDISNQLPAILRISQYYNSISDLSIILSQQKQFSELAIDPNIQQEINNYLRQSVSLLNDLGLQKKLRSEKEIDNQLTKLEINYQTIKALLLRRGAEGVLSIAKMDKKMNLISHVRRINQQAVKRYIHYIELELTYDVKLEKEAI